MVLGWFHKKVLEFCKSTCVLIARSIHRARWKHIILGKFAFLETFHHSFFLNCMPNGSWQKKFWKIKKFPPTRTGIWTRNLCGYEVSLCSTLYVQSFTSWYVYIEFRKFAKKVDCKTAFHEDWKNADNTFR